MSDEEYNEEDEEDEETTKAYGDPVVQFS